MLIKLVTDVELSRTGNLFKLNVNMMGGPHRVGLGPRKTYMVACGHINLQCLQVFFIVAINIMYNSHNVDYIIPQDSQSGS